MEILPILLSLQHNKTGALLISLQIALTLAIVANSAFIIQDYLHEIGAPSGLDEANIFTLSNEWAGEPNDVAARIKEDLAVLRSLPGVIDVEATEAFPLCGCSSFYASYSLQLRNEHSDKYHYTNIRTYVADDHGLTAYGLNLVAGRWFNPAEVVEARLVDPDPPTAVVVTQQLARELFPSGTALGQIVYLVQGKPSRIVGIVEFAASAYFDGYRQGDAAFAAAQYLGNPINYVVRTRPGAQAHVMQVAQQQLYAVTRQRVIKDVRPFIETRRHNASYKRTTTVMLGVVCAVLLTITVFGIIGLTHFWVAQRRRYIGMRRALGARRRDILEYFLLENLLVAGAGCAAGVLLGLTGNTWLRTRLSELLPMSPEYIVIGALFVLLLSQAAVLWPALRAASVPPSVATRGL